MKKASLWLAVLLTAALLLGGCSQGANTDQPDKGADSQAHQEDGGERTIVDLAGNQVVLPPVEKIEHVVIVAPPLVSTYASVVKDTSKLVGATQVALAEANPLILDKLIPNWQRITTTFLTGYASNTEELLKLNPDLILVYGGAQKEGLENVKIPVVDFYIDDQVNETWSVEIDRLMREIFGLSGENSLQKEWDKANEQVAGILAQVKDAPKQKGLMIMSNTGDKITVRGAGTYGDDWLLKSGLENVAGELKGESIEVTMEQIYTWNPDIVYVFRGLPAAQYLGDAIKGQDWSQVQAFKTGRIHDTPRGVMNWGAPCADSPLMIQWLAGKNFPDKFSEAEYRGIIKDYYSRCYGISLMDEQVESVLNPNQGVAGR